MQDSFYSFLELFEADFFGDVPCTCPLNQTFLILFAQGSCSVDHVTYGAPEEASGPSPVTHASRPDNAVLP